MEQKEIDKLKEEIKKEVIEEIRKEFSTTNQYNFDKYKNDVIKDDIKKVKAFTEKKFRASWLIPFFGIYIWSYHAQQAFASIDRGALRVEINRQMMRQSFWIFILAMFCWVINFLFIPYNIALKKAMKIMESKIQNDLSNS